MNRSLLASSARLLAPAKRNISVKSILHGSPEARETVEHENQQHSKLVARGKYVHGFEVHHVQPSKHAEYKAAAEKFYTGLIADPELRVKLTGSWETIVGNQDKFYHILEYENYGGFDKAMSLIRSSKAHTDAYNEMRPFMNSRETQLCLEFAFLPTMPPHSQGGIFELRAYQLKAGALLEWENAWRKGIEARKQFVAPVGAWFSQVGRLHQVHHLWQYESLRDRKQKREQSWRIDGWAETVSKTSKLAKHMDSLILRPLPYSPLK